ncbi:hypothetical protein POTOM_042673 [Populus tomentosa]|uniref:Uncharacterized protein n=1 Tax=Populus tomentosa TaxID=118781 RepID=A0A8X7YG92_POPTO|nr:hypothetical protein POTOM_042673 [Populus tomentosa]
MAASISIKRLLLESSEPASTTMNLHPKQKQDARTSSSSSTSSSKSTRTKFGAAAHEVPSGPNPISNRPGEERQIIKKGICGYTYVRSVAQLFYVLSKRLKVLISSSTGNYGCKGTKLALLQRLNAIPFCF